MIIEIRGLPTNQVIKKISFDIEFNDDLTCNSTQTTKIITKQNDISMPRSSEESNYRIDDAQTIKHGEVSKNIDNMPKISAENNSIAPLENSELIPVVSLSKREDNIDSSMLEESF